MNENSAADKPDLGQIFRLFNEIGIVAQLSGAAFEKVMPGTMTLPQFTVLNHLVRLGDGRTPLEIARALQVSKGAMTNTLGHLERSGWIAVRPDDHDGRSKRVDLTDSGRAIHGKAIATVMGEMAWIGDIVQAHSVEQVLPVLETIRKALDARRS
ncbi:MarR family winged helix-turn-helix transcriptional regulator [Rhizobium alvei]|uniref:MarR family transcriptional regulator n=1 Tax=Rhizobium alvei TaxID=1132659 RepID=A0ABT8YI34_9HYPH|nr:MarR family transcriptional regulator [Rhizobium alvei]MDO6963327.1 MarR family transcriptional regulator [Rhizobium alvei]